MKRKLILLFFLMNLSLVFAVSDFYGKIELKIEMHDKVADPVIYITCINRSKETVKIPKDYIKDNSMNYSYFGFKALYPDISRVCPKYNRKIEEAYNYHHQDFIKLKPTQKVTVKYDLRKLYLFPENMSSSFMINYEGPLGYCDGRILYLEEGNNQYDFDVTLNILKEDNNLIAEMTYKYLSKESKYYKNSYFISDENMPGPVFEIEVNGKSAIFTGTVYDGLVTSSLIKNLRLVRESDIIKTYVRLNDFYELPDNLSMDNLKIKYVGFLGESNVKYRK